jgi:multidrug efflux pump subunit AcrA (membrane-fusion protein)
MTRKKIAIILGMSSLIGLFILRWIQRAPTKADDRDHPNITSADTPAAVAHVKRGRIEDTLTISGAFKPFQDVDIHAKVAGYIKTIYVDVGDHVKAGQTLAILEVPELQAQLAGTDAAVRRAREEIRRAQGDVERAKSTHVAAHDMYVRLSQAAAQKKGLVAEQEVDDVEAKDLGSGAQLSSAQAAYSAAEQALEVAEASQKQYEALSNYTRIVAPFAGVITIRYADTGTLVASGTSSSTQAIPVVRLAQVSKLRLVLQIPESIAAQIHLGDPVKVRVQALNLEAKNNYNASLASLSAILGYPDQQNFQLVEENTEIAPPPMDVNPLIVEAIQQRPEIAALKNEVASAQKSASAEHDLWRPTVRALGVVGQAPVRDNSIPSWWGAVGVNVNIPVFNGFLYNPRVKTADLQTNINRQRLLDFQNNVARDVRDAWQDSNRSFERLSVTRQLREQTDLALDLAQSRYNLGLSSIIEFSQAELHKTEANIADTDAKYQYRLSEIVLAYTTGGRR